MNFRNGKIFAYGHILVACILFFLFFQGRGDPIILVVTSIYLLWSVLLTGVTSSDKPFFDVWGQHTATVYALVDFLLISAVFLLPVWQVSPYPIWIMLFLVSVYAFELGLNRSLFFFSLSIVAIYLYCFFQDNISFFSLDVFMIIAAMLLCVFLIGPTVDRLHRIAFYDPLTKLPNRQLYAEQLFAALSNNRNRLVAVLFLDVDGFKYINDNMGHLLGDHLLRGITNRLGKVIPRQARLARMGGDEFALFLPDMKKEEEAAELAQQLLKQFSYSFALGNQEVYATASIGIAVAPDHGNTVDTLMRNADSALYLAKDKGRNNFQFYTVPTEKDGVERVRMETMLRHALERDELVVYYQPRIELSTGKMVCVEALVRWIHPEIGMIAPGEFIPLAEDTGLIVPIGEVVLRKVCQQHKIWRAMDLPNFRISVNLSARQFRQTDLPNVIKRVLRSTGVKANMLELELTESAAMQDVSYAILMLRVFKEMGFTIAIDDFGTGYSSLSYLKRFPLDVLKIDRSFTRGIRQDSDDTAIVRAIIAIGHSLKLSITAEGVETSEQLRYLEELGCDEIQGFLVGKPMAPDALEQWYRLTFDENRTETQMTSPG